MSIFTVARYYALKDYMHGSLFFSKKTTVFCVLDAICTAAYFSLKVEPSTVLWNVTIHDRPSFAAGTAPCTKS